jgi:hypothetical protein
MGRFPGDTLDGSAESKEMKGEHRWVESRSAQWTIPFKRGSPTVPNPWQCAPYVENIKFFRKYVCLFSRAFVGQLAHVSQAYVEIRFFTKKFCEGEGPGKAIPVAPEVYIPK